MDSDKVNIALTKDEAIVLLEFLRKFNNQNQSDLFNDQAEQRVFWDIECLLEKVLVEPFRKDYSEIVKRACLSERLEKQNCV